MQYINPFELLNISPTELSDVDNAAISKAKRKLLSEIELSDTNTINYFGIDLNKGDCLRAIDDLDNRDKKEFHFFIYQHPHLNRFLTNGELSFFENHQVESIYKLPEFLDFISQFFAEQYGKLLLDNFKKSNQKAVANILSVKPITNEAYHETCYKPTYAFVKLLDNDINKITSEIKINNSPFINLKFSGIDNFIVSNINISLLNLLPSYFQSLRNQLAFSIRDLAVCINNRHDKLYEPAFKVIEIANNIATDALTKHTITKDYYIIKKNCVDNIPEQFQPEVNQTNSQETETIDIIEDEEQQIESNEEKKESKNLFYWVFFCLVCALGFFYSPVQKIILGLSLLVVLIIPLLVVAFRKEKDLTIGNFLNQNIIFISAAALGFFYSIIAQIFVSYYFLNYLSLIYDTVTNKKDDKKSRFGMYIFFAGSVILTLLFHDYLGSIHNLPSVKLNTVEQELTDKEYLQRGLTDFNQSNFNDAISQFDKAINLNPYFIDAYLDRGASKANLSKYDDAIVDYKKAEELGLKSSTLYSNWGYAYYQLKQSKKALTLFDKAVVIDSNNAFAYRWRGEIKYDNNDNKGAAKDYTKAININPTAPNYFARGLAFYYLKDYKKAIQDMDKAIELNPYIAQYYFDRGDAKDNLKDFAGACNDWNLAKQKGYAVPQYKLDICTPKIVYVPNGNITGCAKNSAIYANPVIDNMLKITVGEDANVAVKLINNSNGRCYRYVFIQKNTSFSIKNIPEGKYYLKTSYGNDWTVFGNQSNCEGRFARDVVYKKSTRILDFNLIKTNTGVQIPYFELDLNATVTSGTQNTFTTSQINANDFYNE